MKKRFFSAGYTDTTFSTGIFLLRAAAGALLIPHGHMKMQKFSTLVPHALDPFHLGPSVSLSLSIFAELFCSILIILGLATRLACIPVIINMAVAVFIAHKGEIFGEGEHAALYMAIFTAILFTGPGKYSLDNMISK